MKAISVWSAALVLGVLMSSACGEAPTTPQQEPQPSTGSALLCDGSATTPVLSISDQDIYYECTGTEIGNLWEAPVVTASDICEGSIPVHRYNTGDDDEDGIPGSEDPDDFGPGPTTEAEGLTYVQYLAWDESFNIAGTMLSVYVRDTLKPVITLNGPEYTQVECFMPGPESQEAGSYVDPGASASDQCYGDLSSQVLTFGEVNPHSPGTYSLEYQVQDLAQNWADPVIRAVEVIDSLAPVVTAAPPIPLTPVNGTMRTLQLSQCAMATDRCEGPMDLNSYGAITSITSDEPGDDVGDIFFEEGGSTFSLRAEANPGGAGRTYTVNFVLYDSAGNSSPGACTYAVPAGP
jgi:hypothetical protein